MHLPFAAVFFLAALVVDDQAIDDGFHKRAEAALARIGAAEIAPDELERELLEYLVGRVLVAERRQRVAADRAAIAVEHLLLGRLHGRVVAVCELDDRPERLDLAEMGIFVHGRFSLSAKLSLGGRSSC